MNKEIQRVAKRYGLVDLATGEVFEGVITPWLPKVGGKWVRVFQDSTAELLRRSPELHGQSYRILVQLEAVVKWGNLIPAPPEIAKSLNLKPPNVYRAYAELIKAGIIIKRDGVYSLSPFYCWKGNEMQLEQACRELITSHGQAVRALPIPPSAEGSRVRVLGMGWNESTSSAWVGLT